MSLSWNFNKTIIGLTALWLVSAWAGVSEWADNNAENAKRSVEVTALKERINWAVKAQVISTNDRKNLLAEITKVNVKLDWILDLEEQQNIDTSGQLDEMIAETLIQWIFDNIKNEVEQYAIKHWGKVPLWGDQIDISELDWGDIQHTVFKRWIVEDYVKMIWELAPNSVQLLLSWNFKSQWFDDVIKYFFLIRDTAEKRRDTAEIREMRKKLLWINSFITKK